MHRLEKALIGLRRGIQARQELTIGLGADRKHGAIQKGILGRTAGGVQNKIRPILACEFRRTIDQFSDLRFDAKVKRCAFTGLTWSCSHMVFLNPA
jgi:hypothetical protein